jgi:hypothetical protein
MVLINFQNSSLPTREVPDSQNTKADEGPSSIEIDIQRVPTTPFIEQYSSPSLYASNETPLQTSMSWMPAPRLAMQNFEHGRNQRLPTVQLIL